jgi:hypothetical protein
MMAASAHAAGWSVKSAAVASYLDSKPQNYLVVGAVDTSQPSQTLAEASQTLVEDLAAALRERKLARVILPARVLGDVTGLADPDLVRKAKAVPVDRMIVVRVFEDAEHHLTGVVTVYDHGGQVVTAFALEAGKPLEPHGSAVTPAPAPIVAPPSPANSPGQGVSSEAASSINQILNTKSEEDGGRREYDRSYIGYEEWAIVNGYGVSRRWIEPYEGRLRRPLKGPEFYDKIGRQDLAEAYQHRRNVKIGLGVTGALVAVSGLGVMIGGFVNQPCDPLFKASCVTMPNLGMVGAGAGIFLGGMLLAIIPQFVSSHPISTMEMRGLADAYNHDLRKRLGLGDSASRPKPPRPSLSLAPVISPQFGGVTLRMSF